MAKDAYWFRHDSNARNDQKMVMLRAKHGISGYGAYFMLIEILRESEGYKILANQMLEPSLAFATGCQADFIKTWLADCLEYGLLTTDGVYIWSESLLRRLESYEGISRLRSEAGRLGGLAKAGKCQANAKHLVSEENRVEESRVEKKERTDRRFAPPALDEVKAYCLERKNSVDPSKWLSFYEANGWKVGRNPMKDWKASIRYWEGQNNGTSGQQVVRRTTGAATPVPGKYGNV
jgi:hypothetical protein